MIVRVVDAGALLERYTTSSSVLRGAGMSWETWFGSAMDVIALRMELRDIRRFLDGSFPLSFS